MNEEKKDFVLDKRNFSRIQDRILIICNSNSSPGLKAFTKDISAGGLMLELDRKIPVGDKLDLEICQPINRDKTIILSITTLVKVIWVGKIGRDKFEEGENKYKMGVQFLEINEDNRSRIADYIENKL